MRRAGIDGRTGESVLFELKHSPEVYRGRYRFPWGYLWAHPKAAWAALGEAMPWEALGVAAVVFAVAWNRLGHDLGVAASASVTLPLVAIQMLRSRTFVTPTRIVWHHGLFGTRRSEIAIASILEGRVVYPDGLVDTIGDVLLATPDGDRRLRALEGADGVLRRLLALRDGGLRS